MNVLPVDYIVVLREIALHFFGRYVLIGKSIRLAANVCDLPLAPCKRAEESFVCFSCALVRCKKHLHDFIHPRPVRLHVLAAVGYSPLFRLIDKRLCAEQFFQIADSLVAAFVENVFLVAQKQSQPHEHSVYALFVDLPPEAVFEFPAFRVLELRLFLPKYKVNMQVMRSVQVQRAHQVNVVGAEFRVFQERGKRPLDEFDALFGRVDLRRFLCAERDKAVPDVALIFFQPRFHFNHLLLRDHAPVVEHARVLLQVF